MTFRFATLGSGSKGNCYFVEADGRRILLDAGLSARQIEMRLGVLGIDPASLDGIIISHEHIDHVAGLRVMVKRYGLPVWCNDVTRAALNEKLGTNIPVTIIQTGREFTIGGIRVHPFSVSHDAADPIGLTLQAGNVRLGLAEDLGYATELVQYALRGCRALLLESNHDLRMLLNGPYPWSTKNRIKSRRGHLSNDDAAALLSAVWHRELRYVVLCHVSDVNNRPALAERAVTAVLAKHAADGVDIVVAGQSAPSAMMEL